MFQISQCVMSIFEPLLSTGSGSCISSTKLWVPGGACDHDSAGETAEGPATCVYLSGITPPSSHAVVVISSGGVAGPRPPPARCPPGGCVCADAVARLVAATTATASRPAARITSSLCICLLAEHPIAARPAKRRTESQDVESPLQGGRLSQVAAIAAPRVEDVQRIAALDNPVIRNLEITECYAELSAAMRARAGSAADWCTFATWASRQAGTTIRGEDLLDLLDQRLGRRSWLLAPLASASRALLRKGMFQPETPLGRVTREIHTPFDAFERASTEVARGNLKVFAEIGAEFARFLATVPADAREDSPECLAFVAGLTPGPPPDGQDCLRAAFAHYQRQRREADPSARAAWMLLANLEIGMHEQTRLQPQIAAAVDAPIDTADDLGDRVLHALIPGSRSWSRAVHGPLSAIVGVVARRIRREATTLTRDAVTAKLMILALPGTVLFLGRGIESPLPAELAGSPPPFLEQFVKEYDPCPPGGTACGATDWCDLRQRMHFIVHLFRVYAQDTALFARPFTDDQIAAFRAGRIPPGTL